MSEPSTPRPSRRRIQEPASPGRSSRHQPTRRQSWAGKAPHDILARHPAGQTPPLKVLEVLIELFNALHTSMAKTVSHKTRQERAQFVRRFFRELKAKAGFKSVPDPRNLGQKQAAVELAAHLRKGPGATSGLYLIEAALVSIAQTVRNTQCDHDSSARNPEGLDSSDAV